MIIGIHDGLDSGAALVNNGKILKAVNEERFTQEKNDASFPSNSVNWIVKDIENEELSVALAWISGSALIRRIFPNYENKRRLIWRKKIEKPSKFYMYLRNLFFPIVQDSRPRFFWNNIAKIGKYLVMRKLKGLKIKNIFLLDHHLCHAANAYYTSGFDPCLIITLDGSGDGLSGSICIGRNGKIERIKEFPASASLGILYGAITFALDMRYSEDELKVMSLAPYSYKIEIPELKQLISVKNKNLVGRLPFRYELLLAEWIKDHLLWKYGREALAYGIQKHLEDCVCEIVRNAIDETGIKDIALSGGIFSNVILNMAIRKIPEVRNLFIFPHMGDGGLSAGAALLLNYELNGSYKKEQITDVYLGPEFSNEEIEKELNENKDKIKFEERDNICEYVADLILNEKIVLWFQGKMEYGPRALGNRSILAPAWSKNCKDELNLMIKRRPYFQPFCPTILQEDAEKILEDYDKKPNRFMTMAYLVKQEFLKEMEAVTHIDRTTRPQMLSNENPKYRKVLEEIKKKRGIGVVLNTSFNKHGYPIVCTPKQAIWTLLNSGAKYLAIGDFFVEKLS